MFTESVVNANSPSHSLLSLNGREHLGRVLKCDRSFTQRVADSEEIDEPGRRKWSAKLSMAKILDNLQNNWSNLFATATIFLQQ